MCRMCVEFQEQNVLNQIHTVLEKKNKNIIILLLQQKKTSGFIIKVS